jgi:hypothetical protein
VVPGQAGRSVTFVDEDDRKLVKEIVKQKQGKVQERVVPPASLKKWANQVEQMGGDIERLILVCCCSHLATSLQTYPLPWTQTHFSCHPGNVIL